MSNIWNRGITQRWTKINYGDASTLPRPHQKVIAVDEVGNQAVCVFDGRSNDFLLDVSGFATDEIHYVIKQIIDRTIVRTLKEIGEENAAKKIESLIGGTEDGEWSDLDQKINELLLEEVCDANGSVEPAYFESVAYWMTTPPIPDEVHVRDDGRDSSEIVTFMTYDFMAAIEPSVRHAIKTMMARQQGEEP